MAPARPPLRFDRRELAGAFGDIGTDLPLIAGILLATGMDAAGVFIAFGLAQIATGYLYRLPLPVQPLKAMAVVVIAGQAPGPLFQLAGFLIGIVMLVLTWTGALDALQRVIPVAVVRGVQAGLGLALARTAFGLSISEGALGIVAAAAAVGILFWLREHRRVPGALVVIGLGVAWAAWYRLDWPALRAGFGFVLPTPADLPWASWATALTLLVLPQLPLSLSNSVIATHQTARDLFPERPLSLQAIGRTYGTMNLLAPWLGGIPICHGCGGLAGHHALGARTGGSVVIYGSLYVVVGALFSGAFTEVLRAFPAPVLGAVLLIEAAALLLLLRSLRAQPVALALAVGVAAICVFAPQGYLTGAIAGSLAYYTLRRAGPGFGLKKPPAGFP